MTESDSSTLVEETQSLVAGSTVGAAAVAASEERYRKPLAYADIRLTVLSDEGASVLELGSYGQDVG